MITFMTRNLPSFHFPLYQSNITMLLVAPLQNCYRFLHSELISENFVLLLLDGISGMTFLQIFEQNLARNYLRSSFKILLFPILRLTLYNYFALLPSLIVLYRVYVCVFMFYNVYYIIYIYIFF